jgi:lysozyme
MKISLEGLSLIKKFEGCRLKAYYCSGGVLTIGYGHTGGVKETDTITQEEADELLEKDVLKFEEYVEDN